MTVGFIAGCFDGPNGLHEGHKYILKEAHDYCDLLVVAINDDEYIINKKKRNPLSSVDKRRKALLDSQLADVVRVFHSDPLDLILDIKPNFIFVGNDYKPEEVVGYKESKKWGCQTIIIDRIPNISTTEIIQNKLDNEDKIG